MDIQVNLTLDEIRFLIQALTAVPLSGNIRQLTPAMNLIVAIAAKLEAALPKETPEA
jgi:transcriptional regulator with AAA-type ATPase domain